MQLTGSVTKVERVVVDISPDEMIKALKARWKQNSGAPGEYINSDGKWESWEDTGHGSGSTTYHREATEDEKAAWNAFRVIERLDYKLHK